MVESERDHMDSKRVGGWAWRKELEGSSIGVRLRRLNLESFHSKAALRRVLLVGDKSAQTVVRRPATMAIAAAKVCQDLANTKPRQKPSLCLRFQHMEMTSGSRTEVLAMRRSPP